MNLENIWQALLAFLLGLAAKFIYDLWKERRERKIIVFKKTILSSFVVSTLEEEIREQTRVIYQGYEVQSIHIVQVDLENRGSKPIKNQAFTILFGEKATILGEPRSFSSPEDLRHIELDTTAIQSNSRRFLVWLLLGKRKLTWTIAVINNDQDDFIVDPGVVGSGEDLDKADLDVVPYVTSESVSPDLTVRATRLISFLIMIIVLSLMRETIESEFFAFNFSNLLAVILNLGIIGLWLAVLRESLITFRLFIEWFEGRKEFTVGGDYINIGDILEARGVAVGQSSTASVDQPIGVDSATMQELLVQVESIIELARISDASDSTEI